MLMKWENGTMPPPTPAMGIAKSTPKRQTCSHAKDLSVPTEGKVKRIVQYHIYIKVPAERVG
jgi:hypothetical protein